MMTQLSPTGSQRPAARVLYLKLLRESVGGLDLTQEDLAHVLGTTPRELRRLERATRLPGSVRTLLAATQLFEMVSVEALVECDAVKQLRADVETRLAELNRLRPVNPDGDT